VSIPLKSFEKLAIAVDLGTTTIAASLIDTASGERIARAGALNPQRQFGADVVLRLQAAGESEQKLRTMSQLVNGEIQRLTFELLSSAGAEINDLSRVAIAGNPAMEHLALGLPVQSLAFPPHRPVFKSGKTVSASLLGWNADTEVFFFPLPGGFVGGDLVAFLYGISSENNSHSTTGGGQLPRPTALDENCLCLDLGTNAEIALKAGDRVFATSAAAGPAFEGGSLACGMAALPGAISRVRISGDRVDFSLIGNARPSGLCGSGVIDAVAGLIESGIVDSTGRLHSPVEIPSNLGNRIDKIDGDLVFVVYRDADRRIYLSQKDIREVQLAKAAIRAGIEILLERAGVSFEELHKVILTGSFGSELSPASLKSIGILDEKMVQISDFIRDGVLSGVEKAVSVRKGLSEVDRFAETIRVIPLSGTPAFEKLFIGRMDFPAIKNKL
jgi:uncharacterized 2Fe-2S/4Fe-4S cluster protein (DUF4445 family)